MGGHFPFPPGLVAAFIALSLLPLLFVVPVVMRLVAGPRERIFLRGLKVFGLVLLCLFGGIGLSKMLGVAGIPLTALGLVYGYKEIAETTWARALAGVVLSTGVYAVVGFVAFR